MASTLIKNIKSLCGIQDKSHSFLKGEALSVLNQIDEAYILIENGRLEDFGSMAECPERADEIIDATGSIVLPSWCDSHTHIVFASSREKEFVQRIKGVSYEEIAASGGGILNSAKKLANTSEDELFESASKRLEEVMAFGTGAIEIKSGYGLSFESEIKMLRVIQRLKNVYDLPIKANFLGAHAIPTIYKDNREVYIDIIINKMLPYIADHQLADYIDVFCDTGFYTVEETDQILKAGAKFGLKAKIHANELGNSGGVQVGIKNNAVSVDHLEQIGDNEIEALKKSNTIPTLLPSCSFFLNIPYAPARKMIDNGLGICLASDYNPGSTPSGKIPFLLSLACIKMKLTPEEAINAITMNGAYAMEIEDDYGSITRGKYANLIITKNVSSLAYLPYAFGSDHISRTLVKGKTVFQAAN